MILSAEEFVNLRLSDSQDEYGRAMLEEASDEVWMNVITNYPNMKIWVVRNKTISLEILNFLSNDHDVAVRTAIADKRKLDKNLFLKLARDIDESVRQRIAYNKKTPNEVLEILISDDERMVRDVAEEKLKERFNDGKY